LLPLKSPASNLPALKPRAESRRKRGFSPPRIAGVVEGRSEFVRRSETLAVEQNSWAASAVTELGLPSVTARADWLGDRLSEMLAMGFPSRSFLKRVVDLVVDVLLA